ncbi:MAG: ATP-binding protein [Planctomycetes bacterium]|nr:ATP-binding protein [Planctomycetota bacterium]
MGKAEDIFERINKEKEVAIDSFIADRESESLFLDFKRSADNGDGVKLHSKDRENLAKCISGFGNSEGGVIVWGVDCSSNNKDNADVANFKVSINNPQRFLSWLEGAVSGCTIPPHAGVKHFSFCLQSDGSKGFVITYIPKSNSAPHQVILNGTYKDRYFIRAGSNFEHAPHAVLAGMFVRRPQPHITHMFLHRIVEPPENYIYIDFLIKNIGSVTATGVYMSEKNVFTPGPNCQRGFSLNDMKTWDFAEFPYGLSAITKKDVRVAPETIISPFTMNLKLLPPFEKELFIEFTYGCDEFPPCKFQIKKSSDFIQNLYDILTGGSTPEEKNKFICELVI